MNLAFGNDQLILKKIGSARQFQNVSNEIDKIEYTFHKFTGITAFISSANLNPFHIK